MGPQYELRPFPDNESPICWELLRPGDYSPLRKMREDNKTRERAINLINQIKRINKHGLSVSLKTNKLTKMKKN